jgi:hypothetical protein
MRFACAAPTGSNVRSAAQRSRFPKTLRGKAAVNPLRGNTEKIIADNLSKAGWSWGYVSALDRNGRTIWIADAHRDDGKRYIVRANEKLTAFLELESVIRIAAILLDQRACFLPNSASLNGSESGGGLISPLVLRLFRTRNPRELTQRKKERKNYESIDSTQKSNSIISRRVRLLWTFAESAGGRPTTGRRLSRPKHCRGGRCALQPENWYRQYGNRF